MFALSEPFTPDSANLADRKHIRDAIRTRDFSAGEYIVGKVVTVPTIIYAYPVLDKNRKLIAIVSAGIKLDKYKESRTLIRNRKTGIAYPMRLPSLEGHTSAPLQNIQDNKWK